MMLKCCSKNVEFKRATRARTCCTMFPRVIVQAPRAFSIVGFHVLALHNDSKIRSCMFNKTDLYNFSFDSFSMNLQ